MNTTPSPTPNVVVENPRTRRIIGIVLYVLLFLVAVASMLFSIFPELAFGTDLPARVILFVSSLVTFAGGFFGIAVTTPNVPKY